MGEKEQPKVTIMVLNVDLQCEKCYKKVKKVLCKFPQIRDQIFDEKQNKVTIKVICCSPEKIRDKLCCKGGGSIKSIEIVEPPKKEPEKPKEAPPEKPKAPPAVVEKPKEPEKPKQPEKPKAPEKPKEPEKPKQPEKPKEPEKPREPEKPKEPEKPEKPKEPEKPAAAPPKAPEPAPAPAPAAPPKAPTPEPVKTHEPVQYGYPGPGPVAFPVSTCCTQCYEGVPGGPCYHGYGSQAPMIQYDGYYGRPVYDSWGSGGGGGYNYSYSRPCYPSRCEYINEENPAACTIM